MRRIAFFTPGLKIGGIERVFITYAEEFIRKGYEVDYVICKDDGTLFTILPKGVRIVSLGDRRLRQSIPPLYRYLKAGSADYIITGSVIANALCILLAALGRSKTRVIVSHHHYFNVENNDLVLNLILRYLYNRAFRIFSVSDGITDMLLKHGIRPSKLTTIYNPIPIRQIREAALAPPPFPLPERFLLFLGRLDEVKNLPFLLDVFALVHQKDPTLCLLMMGEGSQKEMLEEKSKALNLQEVVTIHDAQTNPFSVMGKALAVLLPSFSEALPTVILESFALGKTVIATPTNGALDLLENGKLGYISVRFDQAGEFASLIEEALQKPIPEDLLAEKATCFAVDQKVVELETLFC